MRFFCQVLQRSHKGENHLTWGGKVDYIWINMMIASSAGIQGERRLL
jgi:predicted membrane channel-forming protein YqfA (hemolysin III family)